MEDQPGSGLGGASPFPPRRPARSLLAVAVLLALAIGATGLFHIQHQYGLSRKATEDGLSAIADLKTHEIAEWYRERRADAEIIFRTPAIRAQIREYLADSTDTRLQRSLLAWMEMQQDQNQYKAIVLYDARGRPRLHAPLYAEAADLAGASRDPDFQEALRTPKVVITDLSRAATDMSKVRFSQWIPIGRHPGEDTPASGVLVLRIDPFQFLYSLIQSWPTPSRTGETLLIRREGDQVVFLNELRHRRNAALAMRMPIDTAGRLPSALAVVGREGVVEGRDYRGIPVLAALRRIPGTPWFLVAKQDKQEIFAPVRDRARATGLIILFLYLATALGVNQLWRQRDTQWLRQQLAAERARQVLAERIVYLRNQANDIILFMDRDWTILEANQRALDAYGYSLEELQNLNVASLCTSETRGEFNRRIEEEDVRAGLIVETVHQRKDGSSFPVEGSVRRVEVAGEQYHQGIIRDITDRRRSEEARRHYTEELKQSNEEVRQFAYVVSHDLRAPLINLKGFAGEIRRSMRDLVDAVQPALVGLKPEEGKRLDDILNRDAPEALDFIDSSVARMDHLINALLRQSRLGHRDLIMEEIETEVLVREILQSTVARAGACEVSILVHPLPSVRADRLSMEQILGNMLTNAVIYLDPDRPGRIEVDGEQRDSETIFRIRDNGRGIAEENFDKVFAPFRRAGPADVPGEGMGLAYVQTLVRHHGGRIWFESQLGVGTTFAFTIPCNQAEE